MANKTAAWVAGMTGEQLDSFAYRSMLDHAAVRTRCVFCCVSWFVVSCVAATEHRPVGAIHTYIHTYISSSAFKGVRLFSRSVRVRCWCAWMGSRCYSNTCRHTTDGQVSIYRNLGSGQ